MPPGLVWSCQPAKETPSFREGVHELGRGFVIGALGLFQRLARGVGKGVEGVPEALDDLVLFVRRERRRSAVPRAWPAGCWARVFGRTSSGAAFVPPEGALGLLRGLLHASENRLALPRRCGRLACCA